MADILIWPSTNAFRVERFGAKLRPHVFISTSPLNGALETRQIPGSRWVYTLVLGRCTPEEGAEREAFFSELEGQVNRLSLWHMRRPRPRGTLRGNRTLTAAAAAGAKSITISAASGNTILKGDMLGLPGHLVQSIRDVTASGSSITVPIRPALRAPLPPGTVVTWDRPRANFIITSPDVGIEHPDHHFSEGLLIECAEFF